MKKIMFLFAASVLLMTGTVFALPGNGYTPGLKIVDLFKTDFPEAKDVKWESKITDVEVATFSLYGKVQHAYYNEDGLLLGQGWYIDVNETGGKIKEGITGGSNSAMVRSVYLFFPGEGFPVYYARIVDGSKEIVKKVDSYGEATIVKRKKLPVFFNQ